MCTQQERQPFYLATSNISATVSTDKRLPQVPAPSSQVTDIAIKEAHPSKAPTVTNARCPIEQPVASSGSREDAPSSADGQAAILQTQTVSKTQANVPSNVIVAAESHIGKPAGLVGGVQGSVNGWKKRKRLGSSVRAS
jgi:hypothetical protein